jgi:hypothetical protein
MNHLTNFRSGVLLAVAFGAALLLIDGPESLFERQARAQQITGSKPSVPEEPELDIRTISGRLASQSHAMVDVGYHFTNLWFAADKQNWPLASYYLGETRSHLKWAVRMHPVRKTKAGAEVDLNGILDGVDKSFFAQVSKTIENKDLAGFKTAYSQALEGCYSCHLASEKPFLRPQVPTAPSVSILSFEPDAAAAR